MTLVYPTNSEYVSALKNTPGKRFTNPLLKRLTFEKKGVGLAVMTGGLAIVFKATDPTTSKRYALRCFKGNSAERHQRYSEISNFLNARKAQLPFIVDFEFFAEEIRVKSADGLPIVLMEWVDGSLLKQWIQARCEDMDKPRVLKLAEKWRRMLAAMRSHDMAHGDLQHGNMLIDSNDEFILIDYDGMAVPNLHGPDSPELGLPGYQHRERTSGKSNRLSADLDNFSAINIYLCLQAVAIDPGVFTRFGDHDEGLLFHPQDLESPDQSQRFDQLQALGNPQLSKWIAKFKSLATGPMANVPSLEQFLCDPQPIIKALNAADWEKAVQIADEGDSAALPADLVARLELARKAIECRRLLQLAIDSGDERRIASAWNDNVFANYPAARDLAEYGKLAQQVYPVLDEIVGLLKKQDVRKVVTVWDKNRNLFQKRTSTEKLSRQIEDWRERNRLADRAQQVLKTAGNGLVVEIVTLADKLEALGGHPELDGFQEFISVVKRNRSAQRLLQLSYDATAENDKRWIDTWDGPLFTGFAPVASLQQRYTEAEARRTQYNKVLPALSSTTATSLVEETRIAKLAAALPNDYCSLLSGRSLTASQRAKLVSVATSECRSTSRIQESALVSLLHQARKVGADTLLTLEIRNRLELAEKRIPVLEKLALVPQENTLDSDSKILTLWHNEALLRDCDDAGPFRARYEAALERSRLLVQLKEAKAAGDDLSVRDIAENPLFSGFALDKTTQDAVKNAKKTAAAADVMLQRLEGDQEEEFARKMDVESLNRFWPLFKDHHTKIRKWMMNGALKPDYIGLSTPPLGQAVTRIGQAAVRIKWHFPARVTDVCIVTLSRGKTETAADLDTSRILLRQEVNFKSFEQGGSACVLPVGRFEGSSICVWAIVEVCGERFYSAPLNLGRIPSN